MDLREGGVDTQEERKMKVPEGQVAHLQQRPQPQKCARCESNDTKFCYYNNNKTTQPRYFCKTCKRHWTHGGRQRNIPVGGGRRNDNQNKASSPMHGEGLSKSTSSSAFSALPQPLETSNNSSSITSSLTGNFQNVPTNIQSMKILPPAAPPIDPLYFNDGFGSSIPAMQNLNSTIARGATRPLLTGANKMGVGRHGNMSSLHGCTGESTMGLEQDQMPQIPQSNTFDHNIGSSLHSLDQDFSQFSWCQSSWNLSFANNNNNVVTTSSSTAFWNSSNDDISSVTINNMPEYSFIQNEWSNILGFDPPEI